MSRSGYDDSYAIEQWDLIRWRGAVTSALRGKRGQAFLKEMLAALKALPFPVLVKNELETLTPMSLSHWGMHPVETVCALGAVGKARGIDMSKLDPENSATVSHVFGIAEAMAKEIVYINDEQGSYFTGSSPENRYRDVMAWLVNQIRKSK